MIPALRCPRSTKECSGVVDEVFVAVVASATTLAVGEANDAAVGVADDENDIAEDDGKEDDDKFFCVGLKLRFPCLSRMYMNMIAISDME